MSSLSDMVSATLAGLLSAALVHFGASETSDRPQKQRAEASRTFEKSRADAVPTPDDERFRPANPHASAPVKASRTSPPNL